MANLLSLYIGTYAFIQKGGANSPFLFPPFQKGGQKGDFTFSLFHFLLFIGGVALYVEKI